MADPRPAPATLEEFVDRGFEDHAADAAGVFERLPSGLPLADTPRRGFLLAHLATHVAGEHLGRWEGGLALLDRIVALPAFDAATGEGKGVRRLQAVLHLCAGRRGEAERLLALAQPGGALPPASARIRMLAVAAAALGFQRRSAEASAILDEAEALAAYGPGKDDPASRELAMTGNNLAATLEERADRTPAETALMLRAAALGRTWWAVAGDWRNVERAEYRLALGHLAAGKREEAVRHARECLRIVRENGSDAGEEFFALWAVARTLAGSGDAAGARRERDAAAARMASVEDGGFRSFCAEELAKLDGVLARG
jgi:hypothetical protein